MRCEVGLTRLLPSQKLPLSSSSCDRRSLEAVSEVSSEALEQVSKKPRIESEKPRDSERFRPVRRCRLPNSVSSQALINAVRDPRYFIECPRVFSGISLMNGGNAGRGAFLRRDVVAGEFLTSYGGNWNEGGMIGGDHNVHDYVRNRTLIGDPVNSAGPNINDSRDQLYNCELQLVNGQFRVYALEDMRGGTELSMYYGEDYWDPLTGQRMKCPDERKNEKKGDP